MGRRTRSIASWESKNHKCSWGNLPDQIVICARERLTKICYIQKRMCDFVLMPAFATRTVVSLPLLPKQAAGTTSLQCSFVCSDSDGNFCCRIFYQPLSGRIKGEGLVTYPRWPVISLLPIDGVDPRWSARVFFQFPTDAKKIEFFQLLHNHILTCCSDHENVVIYVCVWTLFCESLVDQHLIGMGIWSTLQIVSVPRGIHCQRISRFFTELKSDRDTPDRCVILLVFPNSHNR